MLGLVLWAGVIGWIGVAWSIDEPREPVRLRLTADIWTMGKLRLHNREEIADPRATTTLSLARNHSTGAGRFGLKDAFQSEDNAS